jgi:hypothetical protein
LWKLEYGQKVTCLVGVLYCVLIVLASFKFCGSLLQSGKIIPSTNCRKGTIGKWLHQKQHGNANMSVKRKDRARVENARVHSAVSIAGLASALASVAASSDNHSKLDVAMASATQLLASYCVEMAELAGADHDRVASTVKSAVDIQTPGDLMTLTAAAATGTSLIFLSIFIKLSRTRQFNWLKLSSSITILSWFVNIVFYA